MTKERRQNNSVRKMATDARLRQMLRSVPEDHAGFTQDEIARKAGVAKQTISKIERGAMMKITEQIEALKLLRFDFSKYIFVKLFYHRATAFPFETGEKDWKLKKHIMRCLIKSWHRKRTGSGRALRRGAHAMKGGYGR